MLCCVRSVSLDLLWAILYISVLLADHGKQHRMVTVTSVFLGSCFLLSLRQNLNCEMVLYS